MQPESELNNVINVEEPLRDAQWENDFLSALPKSYLHILIEEPILGPDKMPYLMVSTAEGGKEPALNVIGWLSERGIGLVVNPQKTMPDFVLTYGMIWNYRIRQQFVTEQKSKVQLGQVQFAENKKVISGDASEDYLPKYVRAILKDFFNSNKIQNPKILVMSTDGQNYDLCFSLESLGQPEATEHRNILESISWFLPPNYSLTLVSEQGMPNFYLL